MSWRQYSVGKHCRGEVVDVHVTDRLLEVWLGNELIKIPLRASGGEIRKKRAEKTARTLPWDVTHHPRRIGQTSTETRQPHLVVTQGGEGGGGPHGACALFSA